MELLLEQSSFMNKRKLEFEMNKQNAISHTNSSNPVWNFPFVQKLIGLANWNQFVGLVGDKLSAGMNINNFHSSDNPLKVVLRYYNDINVAIMNYQDAQIV